MGVVAPPIIILRLACEGVHWNSCSQTQISYLLGPVFAWQRWMIVKKRLAYTSRWPRGTRMTWSRGSEVLRPGERESMRISSGLYCTCDLVHSVFREECLRSAVRGIVVLNAWFGCGAGGVGPVVCTRHAAGDCCMLHHLFTITPVPLTHIHTYTLIHFQTRQYVLFAIPKYLSVESLSVHVI